MNTKTIGYAYPTSPLAKDLGYNESGVWYIAVYDDSKPITVHDVVYASVSKNNVDTAVNHFAPEDMAYGAYSFKKD